MSDLIERKRTKNAVDCMLALLQVPKDMREEAIDLFINRIPSAEPKVGKWIDTGENLHKCSNCGQIIFSQTPYDLEEFHAYCGRCGAKMERSE